MDIDGINHIYSLYESNSRKAYEARPCKGSGIFGNVALIATVMDLVREELKAWKPTPAQNPLLKSGPVPIAPLPIAILCELPQDQELCNTLYSLGCENLCDISGWRKRKDMSSKEGIVYQLRIKGRYVTMPENFGHADIEHIRDKMDICGLPFPEES